MGHLPCGPGIPSAGEFSCLVHSVTGINSPSIEPLNRIKQLLKVNDLIAVRFWGVGSSKMLEVVMTKIFWQTIKKIYSVFLTLPMFYYYLWRRSNTWYILIEFIFTTRTHKNKCIGNLTNANIFIQLNIVIFELPGKYLGYLWLSFFLI